MTRKLSTFLLGLSICAAANAATFTTTITVNATAGIDISSGGFKITGTTNMTGGIGAGTITSNIPISAISSNPVVSDYTIAVTSGGTITGKLSTPQNVLTGGATSSASVSMTVTGGTGTYAGANSPAITLTGSVTGDLASGFKLNNFTGSGTIVTGGTGGGGGGGGATGPVVTQVLDAGSYTKNIAQGSIFVVKGTNLSAAGFTQFSFPLPTSSSGVKITFTPAAGGAGTDAYLVYLYNQSGVNQLAAVLPSTVAPGNYNVTVTNGTASAPLAVPVVQRKVGLITADGSGTGLSVIQNYISASQLDIDRFTSFSSGGYTFSPSKPGQVLIAWATGMGPVTGGDNIASPGFDFNANGVNVKVIVGGVSITPLYAGRAPGLAGADQINFQLPSDIPTGCTTSFQVSVNGVLSNPAFIAIAPNGSADACVYPGFTTDQLKKFDNGGTYTTGYFGISSISISTAGQTFKGNSASGGFYKFTGFQLSGASSYIAPVPGACVVNHITNSTGDSATSSGTLTGLDAGAVSLSGPAGSNITNVAMTQEPTYKSYYVSLGGDFVLPGGVNGNIIAGTYTVKGNGGPDVGAFTATVNAGAPLAIAGGLPSVVTRSAGLPLTWTGGNASDIVSISGQAGTTTRVGTVTTTDLWQFTCQTTAGTGGFTVPSSILNQLPAVSASSTTGSTLLQVVSSVNPTQGNGLFTAPLTSAAGGGNIDTGLFFTLTGLANTPTYQ
jgi:uncharacterized protein (TIGR03437 family)